MAFKFPFLYPKQKVILSPFVYRSGPERTRTAYLLIANEAFYQMNYGPDRLYLYHII